MQELLTGMQTAKININLDNLKSTNFSYYI